VTNEGLEVEKNVYVAHFDILGMGAAIKKDSWNAWQNIIGLSEALDCEELPIDDYERQRLTERYFSDTVLITSEDDGVPSLHTILARSLELFRCALRRSIPLRGGIAHGTWFEKRHDNKDLFSGNSLSSAYELGEKQQLLGISVCSTTRERFYESKFYRLAQDKDVILQKSIPIKGGATELRYILNWPALCSSELGKVRLDNASMFSQYFWTVNQGLELDDCVLSKYENTLRLISDIG
jgi:hypothetical protein